MEPIVLTLKDKRLFSKSSNVIALVGDNADYKIHFEDISKTAVFAVFNRNGKTDKKALDENHDVLIPVWLLKKGTFEVGLYSDGFASTGVSIIVRASVVEDEGAETGDVPKSVAEQLIELVNKDIASVKETKTEATAAKDAAVVANEEVKAALESITDKDNGYLIKIKGYADSAKSDASSAAKNAEKIQGAVTAAENALSEAKDLKQVSVEILGEGGTFENPKDNTVLKQIRDIKEEISTAKADVIEAKNAAETAQAAAEAAQSNAAENKDAAQAAKTAAETAQAAAEAAQSNAAENKDTAQAAKNAAETAQVAAEAAQSSAAENKDAAQAAKTAAETAQAAAEAAQSSAAENKDAAQAAKTAAETAQAAAEAAQSSAAQSAAAAAESAKQANQGISVDTEMSDTSTNPVQNKIVKEYVDSHANNYTHPDTHPASMIEQDETHRFVTDAEKTAWNGKVDKVSGKGLSANDYTTAEKNKLSGIADGANNYTHPDTHPASIIEQDASHRFVTDAEKSAWNGKVDKADGKGLSTNDYTTAEKNSLADILTRLSGLKFVISNTEPTAADENTLTIVISG